MAAVTKNLTPSAISAVDYPIAKTPALGGEKLVYLSTGNSRLLGVAFAPTDLVAGAAFDYQFVLTPSADPPGPILAVALDGGILQAAAATIGFGGTSGTGVGRLMGSFTNVGYSSHTDFNFPTGRAVELITGGVQSYVAPVSSSVPVVVDGTIKQGTKFALIEMPAYSTFTLAGCTNNRQIQVPSRDTKSIACGLNKAEWTTPGMTQEGSLEVTGLNVGIDDGLSRFRGLKCQAMLVTVREGRIITQRDFCLDWTGKETDSYGEGDAEATVSLTGSFSRMAVLPAP